MENPTQFPSSAATSTYLDIYLKYNRLSEQQALIIMIVGKVSSAMSVVASTYVIQDILRDPEKRKGNIYHRTMLGVSVSDFIVAVPAFLGTWPMPSGQNMFAVGNDATCNAMGFFTTLGWTLSPLYSCSLATFYLLQLKYSWVERRMRAIEKWLHIIPWIFSSFVPIMALFMDGLGPMGFLCG